jgi:hypothetical protein
LLNTCIVAGCDRSDIRGWGWCSLHYQRWYKHQDPKATLRRGRPKDLPPTPHDELTYDGWHRFTTPLPPLEAIHNTHRATYAAQNERDGYTTDPAYIAAVAAWRADDLTLAAD